MNKFAVLFGTFLFLASTAHAEGFYLGGSVGFGDATLSANDQFDDPDDALFVVKGIGGYRVNEYFAVEGTIIGATNDEYDDGFDGEDEFFFFGANNGDEDENGLMWGAGAFINFGSRKQFTIRLDYEEFDTDALDDFWAVSGGFQYSF